MIQETNSLVLNETALSEVEAVSSKLSDAVDDREAKLWNIVRKIRDEQPGLVARQVHAELLKVGEEWANTTVSEIRRICSKLVKQEVEKTTHQAAGTSLGRALDANSTEEALRDYEQDPSQRDADVNKQEQPGLSKGDTRVQGDRLGTAAERGDIQQVTKLLKKGVDPNYQNRTSKVTPLGVASERGHVEVVKALLDARANTEFSTKEGLRPIHSAATFGKTKVVEVLIKSGICDVNATCNARGKQSGFFPLLYATHFDQLETLAVLLENGADPKKRGKDGLTALHYVYSADAVCMLTAARANVDDRYNKEGNTPLHTAARNGYRDVCLAFLICGAHPGHNNLKGRTPVELALETGGAASNACGNAILGFNVKARLIKQRHEQLVSRHASRLKEGTLDGVLEDIDYDNEKGVDPSFYAEVATSVAQTDLTSENDQDLKALLDRGMAEASKNMLMPPSAAQEVVQKQLENGEGSSSSAVDLADIDDAPPATAVPQDADVAEAVAAQMEGKGKAAAVDLDAANERIARARALNRAQVPDPLQDPLKSFTNLDLTDPAAVAGALESADSKAQSSKASIDIAGAPGALRTKDVSSDPEAFSQTAKDIVTASGDDMEANLLLCHGRLWRWHRKLGALAQALPAKDEWSMEEAEKEAKITKGEEISYHQHLLCRLHSMPKKNIEKAGKVAFNLMLSGAVAE